MCMWASLEVRLRISSLDDLWSCNGTKWIRSFKKLHEFTEERLHADINVQALSTDYKFMKITLYGFVDGTLCLEPTPPHRIPGRPRRKRVRREYRVTVAASGMHSDRDVNNVSHFRHCGGVGNDRRQCKDPSKSGTKHYDIGTAPKLISVLVSGMANTP